MCELTTLRTSLDVLYQQQTNSDDFSRERPQPPPRAPANCVCKTASIPSSGPSFWFCHCPAGCFCHWFVEVACQLRCSLGLWSTTGMTVYRTPQSRTPPPPPLNPRGHLSLHPAATRTLRAGGIKGAKLFSRRYRGIWVKPIIQVCRPPSLSFPMWVLSSGRG